MIDPSSRPQTKRHCIGKNIVAVKAASVSGLSNWFKTPAGVGLRLLHISSKLVAVLGFTVLIASPFSYKAQFIKNADYCFVFCERAQSAEF